MQVLDNTGTQTMRLGYSPFGQVYRKHNDKTQWKINAGVNANKQLGQLMPYQYTGGYTDGNTGLVHLDARWYNPHTSRFVQPDYWNLKNTYLPTEIQHELMRFTGLNTSQLLRDPSQQLAFGYVSGNPLTWVDPWGLCLPELYGIEAANSYNAGGTLVETFSDGTVKQNGEDAYSAATNAGVEPYSQTDVEAFRDNMITASIGGTLTGQLWISAPTSLLASVATVVSILMDDDPIDAATDEALSYVAGKKATVPAFTILKGAKVIPDNNVTDGISELRNRVIVNVNNHQLHIQQEAEFSYTVGMSQLCEHEVFIEHKSSKLSRSRIIELIQNSIKAPCPTLLDQETKESNMYAARLFFNSWNFSAIHVKGAP